MLINFIYVGFGGALGAISRFGINEIFENYLSLSSPIGTLFVNVIGCFLIGLIVGVTLPIKDTSYYFFIIGFLGSFTTMSALTYQTVLMANTNFISALSYIIITIILTILATYLGALLAK
jgi:CrcB protein|tara:strand:- start:5500 stop:5859 length:360 start_codon:yes stop_codon:yes gene_type:complete